MRLKKGKYAGLDIEQVPTNYLIWLSNSNGYKKAYNQQERDEIAKVLNNLPKPKAIKFW